MKTNAVVLSGGGFEADRFRDSAIQVQWKAEIPLLGRPMVEWAVRGLRSCPDIGDVVVVCPPGLASPELARLEARVAAERGDISANLRVGLDALPPSERVLVVSGDLPLLTRECLDDLLEHAPAADLVFPYVERADIQRAYPEREWLYARTLDGHLTGCSAGLVRPEAILSNWSWVEALLNARRHSPLRLAAMFGLPLALRLLSGRVRVRDVEERLSGLLHVTGRGYRTRYAELAMDVDKGSDVAFVESRLRQRNAPPHGNPQ